MINKKVEALMNKQIVSEIFSANLYLAMSSYFESINLKGFAHWLKCQYIEELTHALKFYKHLVDRLGRATIGEIAEPPVSWKSPLAALQAAFDHEQEVTAQINKIMATAKAEDDYASFGVLQWFIDEQIEEEGQTDAIVQSLKLIGDKGVGGLLVLDHHLAKRAPSKLEA